MVSDNTCGEAAIWVVVGAIIVAVGNVGGGAVATISIVGWPLSAIVWVVAHYFGIKFALRGVGVLVEDVVAAELDRREA